MKSLRSKIILVIIVIYFAFMGYKSIIEEKSIDRKLLKEVTIVTDGKVHKKNEGKLVLVSGKINYEGEIVFEELDNPINSFKVTRKVEDYVEKTNDEGKKSHSWEERKVYKDIETGNQLLNINSTVKTITPKVGEFILDEEGLNKIKANSSYKTQEKIGDLQFDGLYYSDLSHEDAPEVGDMRISYNYFNTSKVKYLSVLAEQSDNTFIPYTVDSKKSVYNIYNGKVDTKAKLKK